MENSAIQQIHSFNYLDRRLISNDLFTACKVTCAIWVRNLASHFEVGTWTDEF
jgi:hypothetical protein